MKVFNWFGPRSLPWFHILPLLCRQVAANTEIINFSPSREPVIDLPLDVVGNGSTLHATDNERRWSLEPAALHTPLQQVCERADDAVGPSWCPHELWLFLDLDDAKWASYATFTLRLSWAASTPVDVGIELYTPREMRDRRRRWVSERTNESGPSSTRHAATTRARYARLRAVDAGVPAPAPEDDTRADVPGEGATASRVVPFVVILEPVYLGVLPASLASTVGLLVPIVLAAVRLVPWVIAYVEPYARQARADANTRRRSSVIGTGGNKGR